MRWEGVMLPVVFMVGRLIRNDRNGLLNDQRRQCSRFRILIGIMRTIAVVLCRHNAISQRHGNWRVHGNRGDAIVHRNGIRHGSRLAPRRGRLR
jgi:hypothetical protein